MDHVMQTAVTLVAAAHSNRDREVWGGDRALTYWDRLPDKVRAATYAGPTLAHWWERICRVLGAGQPRRAEDRQAVAEALGCGADRQVLDALRTRTEAVCLHVRLAIQAARDERAAATTDNQETLL